MDSNTVNRNEQPSQVLSVRLSSRELRRVKKTLRNYGITGSCLSEQLRAFFGQSYWRSVRYARRSRSGTGSNTELRGSGEGSES